MAMLDCHLQIDTRLFEAADKLKVSRARHLRRVFCTVHSHQKCVFYVGGYLKKKHSILDG